MHAIYTPRGCSAAREPLGGRSGYDPVGERLWHDGRPAWARRSGREWRGRPPGAPRGIAGRP